MRHTRERAWGLAAAVVVTGVAAGCGGGYGATGSAPTSAAPARASFAAVTSGPGPHLVVDGRAAYVWDGDHGRVSRCTGACAAAWPPLLIGTSRAPAGSGVAGLGTTRRGDGRFQLTLHGHPLYSYAGDTTLQQATGQGSDGFGARWWLLSPQGAPLHSAATASSPSAGYVGPGTY